MIPGKVKDTIFELQKYNLGSRVPSPEVRSLLRTKMRVSLVAHWNSDDEQWEIYRELDGYLIWQLSLPKSINVLNLDIKNYLAKFDSSKLGTRTDEERQKDFKFWFDRIMMDKRKERKDKVLSENRYRQREFISYMQHKFDGHKFPRLCVVPAGPVVGHIKKGDRMVEIRATKKQRIGVL